MLNLWPREVYLVAQNSGQTFDTCGCLTIKQSGANLEIILETGTLEWADEVNGSWFPVPGATAPSYQTTTGFAKKFFRVKL